MTIYKLDVLFIIKVTIFLKFNLDSPGHLSMYLSSILALERSRPVITDFHDLIIARRRVRLNQKLVKEEEKEKEEEKKEGQAYTIENQHDRYHICLFLFFSSFILH